jgi:hypothetical protein
VLLIAADGITFSYWMGQWTARAHFVRNVAVVAVVMAVIFTLPALKELRRRVHWLRNVQKLGTELSLQLAALGIGAPTAVYTAGAGTRLAWVELRRVFEIVLSPSGREAALMEVAAPSSFVLDERHLEEWDSFARRDLVAAAEAETGDPLPDRVTQRGGSQEFVALGAATPALVVQRLLELAYRAPR